MRRSVALLALGGFVCALAGSVALLAALTSPAAAAPDVGCEYCMVEWLWDKDSIRVQEPGRDAVMTEGSYEAVVHALSLLGRQGWRVVSCAAAGNWLFWTLERPVS